MLTIFSQSCLCILVAPYGKQWATRVGQSPGSDGLSHKSIGCHWCQGQYKGWWVVVVGHWGCQLYHRVEGGGADSLGFSLKLSVMDWIDWCDSVKASLNNGWCCCFSPVCTSLGNIKLRWKLTTTLIHENLHRCTLTQNNTFYWMHLCLKWFVPYCCRYSFYLLWEQESWAMAARVVLKLPPWPPFSCFPMWTSNCLQASVCSCWTLAE